ncbi:hypothetical protein ACFW96_28820 [Streptomyces gardneri]|uniref:aromatic-ring hydroxylase C-terminal domain-containing protein n=1 Tax=Streptomyces gardneri TaxID=66892 RepID=UPI0036D12AFB
MRTDSSSLPRSRSSVRHALRLACRRRSSASDPLASATRRVAADDPDVRARAAGYASRVDTLTASCLYRPDLAAVLLRPDGITAWAADAGGAGVDGRAGGSAGGVVRSARGCGDDGLICCAPA